MPSIVERMIALIDSLSSFTLWFGSVAALATALLPIALLSALSKKRNGVRVTGTVIEMEEDPYDHGWLVHVGYEVDGVRHRLRAGSNGGYVVGESVPVRYSPDNPARSFIDSDGRIWLETVAALIIAVTFGVVSALSIVFDRFLR